MRLFSHSQPTGQGNCDAAMASSQGSYVNRVLINAGIRREQLVRRRRAGGGRTTKGADPMAALRAARMVS